MRIQHYRRSITVVGEISKGSPISSVVAIIPDAEESAAVEDGVEVEVEGGEEGEGDGYAQEEMEVGTDVHVDIASR